MAKKIELLHTTYDESGNIESQEVVHPLTSPDCIIMENGKTLDEVMGDGIATPTLTHEGTSFKVGVGDSNIEVVDGDVAGMTLKGQSYQNILPKPTTLIMETDEKEFKINDKIDSNIIIDDNIAEIATVKGKTIVNTVQEESGSEYTVLGEDLSGQSIVHIKETPTLEGNTLVNVDTITSTTQLVYSSVDGVDEDGFIQITANGQYRNAYTPFNHQVKPSTKYLIYVEIKENTLNGQFSICSIHQDSHPSVWAAGVATFNQKVTGVFKYVATTVNDFTNTVTCQRNFVRNDATTGKIVYRTMVIEYQEGMENWDIPYFEGTKYFESNIKGVTLQGQTLVNTIQEPCKDNYVVLGADDGIEISAETSGCGTIEDTVQGGINGAVLEGQTLVNLANLFSFDDDVTTSSYFIDKTVCETSKLQVNKPYLICFKPTVKENLNTGNYVHLQLGLGNSKNMTEAHPTVEGSSHTCNINHNEWNFIKITFKDFLGYQYLTVRPLRTDSPSDDKPITYNVNEGFMLLEYQEGMENWDIPYFEGMKSVQMPVLKTTGKNLFDIDTMVKTEFATVENNIIKKQENKTPYLDAMVKITGLKIGATYTISGDITYADELGVGQLSHSISYYDVPYGGSPSYVFVGTGNVNRVNCTFVAKYDTVYITGSIKQTYITNLQVEEGSTATSYEPHKSNILTVNEEVELRGIGDVKDELNLSTGKLTQRIGEMVLDGSEDWRSITFDYLPNNFTANIPILNHLNDTNSKGMRALVKDNKGFTNNCVSATVNDSRMNGKKGFSIHNNGNIYFTLPLTECADLTQWKQQLASQPLVVQYAIKPTIKTIDLQTTDQNGNTIPHIQTQPTVTHITTSSDYLIPTVTIDNNLVYDTIIKPSTLYTVRFKHDTVNTDNPLTVDLGGTTQTVTSTEFTITTPSELTHSQLVFSGKNNVVSEVQVIEGDVVGTQYPFFEGMNDVKFSDSKFVARGKNLFGICEFKKGSIEGFPNENVTITNDSISLGEIGASVIVKLKGKPNTKYTISFTVNNTSTMTLREWNDRTQTTDVNGEVIWRYGSYNPNTNNGLYKLENIQIEEGSTATSYEPYKGVEVQQDVDSIPLTSDMFEQGAIDNAKAVIGMSYQQIPTQVLSNRLRQKLIIPIKQNATYTLNHKGYAVLFDKNGCFVMNSDKYEVSWNANSPFTIPANIHYIGLCLQADSTITPSDLDSMNLILQEVPQEIVLRSIGDVKDTLNLTTGEYVQRIGEVVLDGSEDEGWDLAQDRTNTMRFNCYSLNIPYGINGSLLKTDKLPYQSPTIGDQEGAVMGGGNTPKVVSISIMKAKLPSSDIDGFKQWLSQNPTTVQYELATPIIKKVNLTNTTKLPSYNSITHYDTIVPSDSLVPNITIPSTLNYNVAIKPSTEYTIRANTSDNLTVDLGGATGTLSNGKVTLTTPATLTHNEVKFSGTGKVKELMVVEGSEIKDNVPFFNGMKNVEMGGIKLVNVARYKSHANGVSVNTNKTTITFDDDGGVGTASWGVCQFYDELLKPNTMYTIFMNVTKNTSTNEAPVKIQLGNASERFTNINRGFTGKFKEKIVTSNDISERTLALFFRRGQANEQVVIQNPMIIEGDWTHLDEIPFIESEMIIEQPIIRSQGKNLLDPTTMQAQSYNGNTVTKIARGFNIKTSEQSKAWNENVLFYIDVEPYTEYTYSFIKNVITDPYANKIEQGGTTQWREGYCFIRGVQTNNVRMESSSTNGVRNYMPFNSGNNTKLYIYHNAVTDTGYGVGEFELLDFQLEKGRSTTTSYEPYKHQTLYSNRVIGYEEGVHYGGITGIKSFNPGFNSVMADVEGLSIAYVTNGSSNFSFWDKDMVFISGKSYLDTSLSADNKNGFIQVPLNAKYMKFASANTIGSATDYTKATVTGELPLRSLPNGVCDTLNLVTGEYVQRVGEVVLDGSEDWNQHATSSLDKTNCFSTKLPYKGSLQYGTLLWTDKISNHSVGWANDVERIWINEFDRVTLHLFKNKCNSMNEFKQYLSQNPITVQYELATPIVRKLDFTTKGNYREQVLDGSETWTMDAIDNTKTVRMTKKTVSPLQNALYDTVLFTDDYHVRAKDESHNTYEYITCIGNGIYINIYQSKVKELSIQGCTQWLSQNPIKVGYITSTQSSESYSNIHKPIFFNNVNVQFLPNNVDIQPELTYQVRTRNSYVMDMMKPNTKYSVKLLLNTGEFVPTIDGVNNPLVNGRTFTSPSTLTNKLLITPCIKELMIIEGDVAGKNLPYFKGILSSYHDVDEIEVYSVNKNLFDMSKVKPYEERGTYWWNTIVKENEVVSVRVGDINNGQFGAYIKLNVRPNSVYTLYIEMEKDGEPFNGQIYGYENGDLWGNGTFTGYANTPYHINTSHNAKYITIGFNYGKDLPIGTTLVSKNMRLYLGEESPVYIPHAHNTTLIEMPTRLETVKVVRPVMEKGCIINDDGTAADSPTEKRLPFIPVQPGEILSFRNRNDYRPMNVHLYDIDKNFIRYIYTDGTGDLIIPDNCYFIRGFCRETNTSDLTITRQAWKSIQLNSLPNGVYDEIVMKPNSNKAQLVQRVGKVVLDGSGSYYPQLDKNGNMSFIQISGLYLPLAKDVCGLLPTHTYCDKLMVGNPHFKEEQGVPSDKSCVGVYQDFVRLCLHELDENEQIYRNYLQQNPITVYYELATPIIHEIQLKDYPHVYENGTVTLNTDVPHQTLVSYNVNQEQLINTQNETIIRHDQQIDDLYYYIEMYLEEIYQMELFRMKLELSL